MASSFGGAPCWRVGSWEFGVTEGGSSGSPVVNSSGQVVGQLSGGCGYNINDVCDEVQNRTVDGAFAVDEQETEEELLALGHAVGNGGHELERLVAQAALRRPRQLRLRGRHHLLATTRRREHRVGRDVQYAGYGRKRCRDRIHQRSGGRHRHGEL